MSSTTTNLGLVKMASGETIGQWSDANNGSGGNLDKIDTAVGNLNSQKLNKAVACFKSSSSGTTVFNISSGSRLFVFVVDSSEYRCGVFIVFANASGAVTVVDVKTSSGISFTGGQNTLTFTSTSGTTPQVGFINAYDNLPISNYVSMQT